MAHKIILKELKKRGFKQGSSSQFMTKDFERKEKPILVKTTERMNMYIHVSNSFSNPDIKATTAIYANNLEPVNCVFKGEIDNFKQLEDISKLCFNNIKFDKL